VNRFVAVTGNRHQMTARADVIFVNGTVFDGRRLLAPGTDVAVRGETIVAVGPDALSLRDAHTEVVDLDGGLLQPGFVDAHIHPIEGGLERMRCDLSVGATSDDYLSIIRDYAAAHPDEQWIRGGGWQLAAFPGGIPPLDALDAAVPDRPVFLANRDHHGAWVNSRALELAGIDAHTPDPADGRIERFADGRPNGVLQEGARELVTPFMPADTPDDEYAALLSAQAYLHSLGVTGWQDAIVGNYGSHTDTGDVYRRAADNGDLTATVRAALWWDRERGLDQLDELVARRDALRGNPRFSAASVKVMQDGIPENQTAAMINPYLDPSATAPPAAAATGTPATAPATATATDPSGCRCGTPSTGHSYIDPADLRRYVTALDAADFQVHVHAIGDRAVREALDALEAARTANGRSGNARAENGGTANGRSGNDSADGRPSNRHHIAHVQIVHPDDVPRFAEVDAAVNMQALWATFDPQMVELNLPILGDERAAWQYPFAALERAGARLGAGSDWPVTTPDPWQALHVAVNRRLPASDPDFNPRAFFAEQALTLETALAAYTSGSAHLNGQDDAGCLAPGFAADLVVLDRDPFAAPADEIHLTRTRQTWVRGRRIYDAPAPDREFDLTSSTSLT
jgi:predicted amidohydrolase YtcJ